MKRNGFILLVVALLVLPIFVVTLTSCAGKEVKEEEGVTEEAKPGEVARKEVRQEVRQEVRGDVDRDAFLREHGYFDFDKYNIRPGTEVVLRAKAVYMNNSPKVKVRIEGYCDERGTEAYNMALGDRRAKSAKAFMTTLGISGRRMTTESYGENSPVDPGHNEAAWALNRRVEFKITRE